MMVSVTNEVLPLLRQRWGSGILVLGLLGACGSQGSRELGAATGSGGNGGAATASGGAAGAAAAGTCDRYCAAVTTACTGEFAQYTNVERCLKVCEGLPEGSVGSDFENTIQCRVVQAGFAQTLEADAHCGFAGPAGGGRCGTICDSFCRLFATYCPTDFSAAAHGDIAGCTAACAAEIPDVAGGSYDTGFDSGNSIQCRLWHVSAAAFDPSVHCMHAAGASPCTD